MKERQFKILLPERIRGGLRGVIKKTACQLLGLIGESTASNGWPKSALYVNEQGFLKLRPDLTARLHQSPAIFAIEAASIMQYYQGGIHLDIGCGSRKITASAIGVDVTDGAAPFVAGSVNIVTAADNLYMFADGTVDFISAIHSFEHYANPVAVLREWRRVLRTGGRIGIVVPRREGLIPDKEMYAEHQFDYNAQSLTDLVADSGAHFRLLALDTLQNGWSIDMVLEKVN